MAYSLHRPMVLTMCPCSEAALPFKVQLFLPHQHRLSLLEHTLCTGPDAAAAVQAASVSASEERSEQTGERHAGLSASGESAAEASLADTAVQQPLRQQEAAPPPQRGAAPTDDQRQPAPSRGGGPIAAPPAAPAPPAVAATKPAHAAGSMAAPPRFCPPHGAKAICGRRARMEDAYTAVPFLLEVPMPGGGLSLEELVPPRIATHVKSASGSDTQDSDGESETPAASEPSSTGPGARGNAGSPPAMDALHFFGVFDGHGGAEAALHCARTLHERIAEALKMRSAAAPPAGDSFAASTQATVPGAAATASAASSAAEAEAAAPPPARKAGEAGDEAVSGAGAVSFHTTGCQFGAFLRLQCKDVRMEVQSPCLEV